MSMADTGGMLPGSARPDRRQPGRFVNRRWTVFLFVGLGVLVGLVIPLVRHNLIILFFFTAELLIYVGIPLAFIIWLFLLTRYFGWLGGKGLIGYACKSGLMLVVSAGIIHVLLLPLVLGNGYVTQAMGFWCRMKVFADVEDIREWGETVKLSDEEIAHSIDGWLPYQGERPACIEQLLPTHVSINAETRTVRLAWGSGLGHWGLYVGPVGAERPGGFTLMLAPGAYVWSDTS